MNPIPRTAGILSSSLQEILPSLLPAVLFAILAVLSNIALFATAAFLIGSALLQPSIAALQVAIVGVRFFGLLRGGMRYLERLSAHSAAFRFLERLRLAILGQFRSAPSIWFRQFAAGDLLARFVGDVDSMQEIPLRIVLPAAAFLPLCILAASLLLSGGAVSGHLAAVYGIVLILTMAIFTYAAFKRAPPLSRAPLAAQLVAWAEGLPEILVNGDSTCIRTRMQIIENSIERNRNRHRSVVSGLQSALMITHGAFLAAAAGALLQQREAIPVGAVTFTCLAIAFLEILTLLPAITTATGEALPAIGRIGFSPASLQSVSPQAINPRTLGDPSRPGQAAEFHAVRYRYETAGQEALRGISFSIPVGARCALLGASGSGKTTLFHILLRFAEAHTGDVLLFGSHLRETDAATWRREISAMLTEPAVWSAGLRSNIEFGGPPVSEEAIADILARLGLSSRFPREQWDTPLGERGLNASAGELRRIALARALLQPAPILLLDEPAESLDLDSQITAFEAINHYSYGRTLICATHSPEGLRRLDYVIVLREGVCTFHGPMKWAGEEIQRLQ